MNSAITRKTAESARPDAPDPPSRQADPAILVSVWQRFRYIHLHNADPPQPLPGTAAGNHLFKDNSEISVKSPLFQIMKIPALSALIGAATLLSTASGTILLNEVHINPPPDLDLNYEYIELRSTTDGVEACTGLTLLIIENNGGQVGEVEEALNLTTYSTGTNGLLLIGNGYDAAPQGGPWAGFKAPETTVADPSGTAPWSGLGDDNIDPSGGLTFLLVAGWTGLSNATASSLGDVDVNNNSVLDWLETPRPPGSQQTQPYTTLVDSIGFRDLANTPVRLPYTSADLNLRPGSAATFAPDNISRRGSRAATPGDQNNTSAWYGGNLAGTAANAISYDVQFFGDFKGQATPGLPNLDAAPVVGNFLINEVAVNPPGPTDGNFEYIEIVNAAQNGGAASLQGLALLIIRSNDANGTAALGTVREAWDLGAYSTGANGLLLLGQNYPDGNLPWAGYVNPQTQLGDPAAPATQNPIRWSSMGDDDIGSSDGFTLLLVQNFTGTIDQDLDTNNDGVLDVTPWTAIRDSVGFDQLSPGIGKSYAPAKITPSTPYEIANLSRKLGNTTANTQASWYGGDYGGKSLFTIAFTNDPLRPPFGGFRGSATPGRTNLNSAPEAAPIRFNEVQIDPVPEPDQNAEYLELINTDLTIGGMTGLTLVVANGVPGASNGRVLESIDLSSYSTGPNGLILLGDSYEDENSVPGTTSPLTVREDPDGLNGNDFGPNEGILLLLVKGGAPEVNANISSIPAADIVDSIGFGVSSNPAVTLLSPGFEPDNISRYPGNLTAHSASSWFSGQIDVNQGADGLYFGATFSGTYKGGASPGRRNHAATPSSTATLLLNELNINPPGADGIFEFIEYRARPASALSTNGFTLLMLDGSGNNTGSIVKAWSLDGLATGTNGLLLTGAGYPASIPWTGAVAPAAATGTGAPATMTPGDIAGYSDNGAVSFLLVRDFKGLAGQDLDAGLKGGLPSGFPDDGVLDDTPWTAPIADAAGLRLWDTSLPVPALSGRVYGGVDLSRSFYTPDNVSRRGDNSSPLTVGAWYGGDIIGDTGTSTTFDSTQQFPGGTFVGSVTPGQPNAGAPLNDLGDDDNDSASNLIEAALNMNPAVPDPQNLPRTGIIEFAGRKYPSLSYTRFVNGTGPSEAYSANGFLYQVQVSVDMVNWLGLVSPVSVTARDPQTETAVVRPESAFFESAMANGGKVFLRLKISRL